MPLDYSMTGGSIILIFLYITNHRVLATDEFFIAAKLILLQKRGSSKYHI